MGRKETFKKSEKNVFDSMLEEPLLTDNIMVEESFSNSNEVPDSEVQKKERSAINAEAQIVSKNSKKRTAKKKEEQEIIKKPNFGKKKSDHISRSFNIPKELSEIIDEAVRNSNGEKIAGSYGFIKTVVTNGIIKELIEIGVLSKDYSKNLRDYE